MKDLLGSDSEDDDSSIRPDPLLGDMGRASTDAEQPHPSDDPPEEEEGELEELTSSDPKALAIRI